MKEKIDLEKLSVMDHADTIEKKKKVKRVVLAQSKTVYSRGVTHALESANKAPIFEGSSGNAANPVPSNG